MSETKTKAMSQLLQPIKQIVTPDILSCAPETPVFEAARRMAETRCGSIIVMNETGEALGIWTETDALKVDFSDEKSCRQPISEVMSQPVVTLTGEMTVHDATGVFRKNNIRHALVSDGKQYLGVVSVTDIIFNHGAEAFLGLKRLDALELTPAGVIDAGADIRDAINRMRALTVDALGVRFADGSHGILTQRDVIRLLAQGGRASTAGEASSATLLSLPASTSLLQARRLLIQHQVRHLGVLDNAGQLAHIVGLGDILQNIEHEFVLELHHALRERDEALLRSRQSLLLADKVFESTLEGILITDGYGIIRSVNPAFTRITGYSAEEAIGQTPAILKSGKQAPEFYEHLWNNLKKEGFWQGEVINRRKNGLLYTEHLSITGIRDESGGFANYVAVFSDITQRKQAEERLHFLANHDALTGLPNRTLFIEKLQMAVMHAKSNHQRCALLFIDLDRFKLVNDTLGHHAGDELLCEIAEGLRRSVPADGTVARLSGDEFIILLENVGTVQQVASQAQAVLDQISGETVVSGQEVFVSASVGISMYPEDGTSADTLLVNADTAMYRAKERGKNTFQFYTADMNARALERLRLEYALHRALAQDELQVWYQPKVQLATGRIIGAEALIRWQHPEMGMVSPAVFIPIAEESSLIVSLGEWAFRTACETVAEWKRQALFPGRIAVNISGRQLKFGGIAELVSRTLSDLGMPSDCLELEVTESVAMDDDSGMIDVLYRLQELGVYLSIDDFGTGYSSLSYLKRLPVRGLKIDRSFVLNLHEDRDDAAIARAIISIAGSLGLDLVAEGVELEEHREFLLRNGCIWAQGYLFSRPLPPAEFEARLRAQQAEDLKGAR